MKEVLAAWRGAWRETWYQLGWALGERLHKVDEWLRRDRRSHFLSGVTGGYMTNDVPWR